MVEYARTGGPLQSVPSEWTPVLNEHVGTHLAVQVA